MDVEEEMDVEMMQHVEVMNIKIMLQYRLGSD